MKITERQIWYLLNTLRDTLTIEGEVFSINREARLGLYNNIINQQDNVIREFPDEEVQGREADRESEDTG